MKSAQTLFDVALQVYGDIAKVFQLIEDNPDLDNVHSGNANLVVEYEEQNLSITNFYKNNTINLVSGFPTIGTPNITNWILFDGTWNDSGIWVDSENWND
jgi:hypothetical protein